MVDQSALLDEPSPTLGLKPEDSHIGIPSLPHLFLLVVGI